MFSIKSTIENVLSIESTIYQNQRLAPPRRRGIVELDMALTLVGWCCKLLAREEIRVRSTLAGLCGLALAWSQGVSQPSLECGPAANQPAG